MTTNYKVIELFCVIDEFYIFFDAENVGEIVSWRGKGQSEEMPSLDV